MDMLSIGFNRRYKSVEIYVLVADGQSVVLPVKEGSQKKPMKQESPRYTR